MVDQHLKSATSDDLAFANAAKKGAEGTLKDNENASLAGQLRYAVYVQAPTDTDKVDFGAKLVELGPPVCNGKVATERQVRRGRGADEVHLSRRAGPHLEPGRHSRWAAGLGARRTSS